MSKALVVTGATGQLGQEVCRILQEHHYDVFGTTRPGSNAKSPYATTLEADLTDPNQAEAVIATIRKKHPSLHGVICIAGGFGMQNISNTGIDDINRFYRLNFETAYNMAKAAWPWMERTGGGHLIFIGAKPAMEGSAFEMLPYALSKGSVIQLAAILNEKTNSTGIKSTVIVPSIIDTPANREAMPEANPADWVTAEQIAHQMLHLLSDQSDALRDTVLKLYGNS